MTSNVLFWYLLVAKIIRKHVVIHIMIYSYFNMVCVLKWLC